jgi:hypothetical protein
MLTNTQIKALTIYLELSLVDRQLHSEYICLEYETEDAFWDILDQLGGLELPYV